MEPRPAAATEPDSIDCHPSRPETFPRPGGVLASIRANKAIGEKDHLRHWTLAVELGWLALPR